MNDSMNSFTGGMAGTVRQELRFYSRENLPMKERGDSVSVRNEKSVRVAAYIRVSTDSEDQENSYEMQERYFRRMLLQNREWVSVGIYADYGLSGTNQGKRTGFQRILRHCREGKIDRIICKSISRFARNTSDFMTALSVLRESGVSIFFEKENLDTADSSNEFILTALGAIAQEESRSISENIRWGIQRRYAYGETGNIQIYGYRYAGGADAYITTMRGYRMRKIVVVEKEAEVVRRIFREAAEGKTFVSIARDLNFDHIPAPEYNFTKRSKRKREKRAAGKGELKDGIDQGWTARNVSGILQLERYTGDVLLQKTYTSDYLTHQVRKNRGEMAKYLVKNHHPAIVSRELFEKVQNICRSNREKYRYDIQKNTYPFSKCILCAHCGRFYHLRNTRHNFIWFCPSSELKNGKTVCSASKIYEKQVVKMLRKAVLERFGMSAEAVRDDMNAADLVGGRYEENLEEYRLADGAGKFVQDMLTRLENIQRLDYIERDRCFLKKKIEELEKNRNGIEWEGKIENEKGENKEKREEIEEKMDDEKKEEERIGEKHKLTERLAYLEQYWEELEESYEWRKNAVEWMEKLPEGKEGMISFLNGMTKKYVKAFVLSILVHSPQHYTVHWFDDTRTEVIMDPDIGECGQKSVLQGREGQKR